MVTVGRAGVTVTFNVNDVLKPDDVATNSTGRVWALVAPGGSNTKFQVRVLPEVVCELSPPIQLVSPEFGRLLVVKLGAEDPVAATTTVTLVPAAVEMLAPEDSEFPSES